MSDQPGEAIVLFGHGGRDPRWADPLRAIAARVAAARPGTPCELAFLEFLDPDLVTACRALAARDVRRITVVPVFLSGGGHVLRDLPLLIARATAELPRVAIEVRAPVGERPDVIDAIARSCIADL